MKHAARFAIVALGSTVLVASGQAKPVPEATVELTVRNGGGQAMTSYYSIAVAVAAAAAAKEKYPRSSVRLDLGSGIYHLNRAIVLPSTFSGTPAVPTVIAAATGAKAIVSGSHLLPVVWHSYRGGIFVADVSDAAIDQLWVDGKRQIRARYPNYDPKIVPFGGYSVDALSAARIARWANPAGGEIHAMQVARWGSTFFAIKGKNPDGTLILGKPTANNRVRPPEPTPEIATKASAPEPGEDQPHKEQRYVENIFEELDAPGEWYFDAGKGKLYYMPPSGVELAKANVEATGLEQLLVVNATESNPVHDVRIEGLTFTHTARTVMKATEPMVRSDWAIYRSGAVTFEGAERVVIANSDLLDLGGNAVFVSGHNRGILITGNRFDDIGGTAVSFMGRREALRTPVFQYADSLPIDRIDRTAGPKSDAYPTQSVARDNLITRVGIADKQAAGVAIDIAQDITVGYNSIYDVPRAGINIGDGAFGGQIIEHNDVFDTVLETGDHGAFNSWGRDRYWHPDLEEMRRRVAADPKLPFLDAVKPNVIRNNRWRTDEGYDVDLDDGSSNYEIYNNVLLVGGLKLREGFRRIVTNNIIINNGLHPHVSFKNSGDVFEHNIVMGPYQPILVDQWDFDFDYNLFTNPIALKAAQALGADKHSAVGDPMYVDAARGDFRVRPGSPALKLGFTNFPMVFGVESPRLRDLARTPAIPPLLTTVSQVAGKTYVFSGATVKSLETLGEQSATGAPDRTGALVLAVVPGSKADQAGLRRGDLIRSVEVMSSIFIVADAPTLLVLQASQKWQVRLHIDVLRQQRIIKLEVPYK